MHAIHNYVIMALPSKLTCLQNSITVCKGKIWDGFSSKLLHAPLATATFKAYQVNSLIHTIIVLLNDTNLFFLVHQYQEGCHTFSISLTEKPELIFCFSLILKRSEDNVQASEPCKSWLQVMRDTCKPCESHDS